MKIGVIKNTDFVVDYQRKSDILEQIENAINDDDVFFMEDLRNENSLLEFITKTLKESLLNTGIDLKKKDDKWNINSTVANMTEKDDYIYVVYYVTLEDALGKTAITKEEYNNNKINKFASQLLSAHIVSDLIITKQKMRHDPNNSVNPYSLELHSIVEYVLVRDIVSIFLHRALIIHPSGDTQEYYYVHNPLDEQIFAGVDFESKYRSYEYETFNHFITLFVDITCPVDDPREKNVVASQIANAKIYGDVLISLTKKPEFKDDPVFVDLTDYRFQAIRFLRSRSPDILTLTDDMMYANLDRLLENAKNKHKLLHEKDFDSFTDQPLNLNK